MSEVKQLQIEREGKFHYLRKNFFGCTKLIDLFFVLTKDDLLFFEDENKKKLFLKIKRDEVIAINKRQIERTDIFKFSIHYQKFGEKKLREIKLKANGRYYCDSWIQTLRILIKPKKYEFVYDKKTFEDVNKTQIFFDNKELYIKMCNLEYILLRNKMANFFGYYHSSKNKNNYRKDNNNTVIENNNNEDNSLLFRDSLKEESKNENNKFVKDQQKDNLEVSDIKPDFDN